MGARCGIIAEEVSYGKTAITLGLIDSAEPPPPPPKDYRQGFLHPHFPNTPICTLAFRFCFFRSSSGCSRTNDTLGDDSGVKFWLSQKRMTASREPSFIAFADTRMKSYQHSPPQVSYDSIDEDEAIEVVWHNGQRRLCFGLNFAVGVSMGISVIAIARLAAQI